MAAAVSVASIAQVALADPVPAFIPADAHWLTTVNYYRAMSGLAPVSENTSWSSGAVSHSCYMLQNDISHDEVPGNPGYTSAGDAAGNSGNVAVSSSYGTSARRHIELWMTGPFHAIGVLRHNLRQVGYGQCDNQNTSPWRSGATLDVLRGLTSAPRPANPILFPGNGTTTSLDAFVTEYPDPTSFCGWGGTAGLPVIAMMPEPVSSATASITGPNGPLETCRIFSGNTNGTAEAILRGDNAVVVMPRAKLAPGTYTVRVTTQARAVTWSFTVDPAAATGVMPVPNITTAGRPSGFVSIEPFRFADSRERLRITRLRGGLPKRIPMAGHAGLPLGINAVSANLTVVNPAGGGYVTAYNCSSSAPTAASLNFQPGGATGNAGVYPLNSAGELCVVASTDTDLVIDLSGYTKPATGGRLTSATPQRVVDTTRGLRVNGKLRSNVVVAVDAGDFTPADAEAVVLNATVSGATDNGYVSFFPCDGSEPDVAGINQRAGLRRSNQVIVPLAADGTFCMVSSNPVDVQLDFLGSVVSIGSVYIPTSPTRIMDTRDRYRTAFNGGTAGQRLRAGQVLTMTFAGERGIPADATSLALNVAVVGAARSGTLTIWPCGAKPSITTTSYSSSVATNNGVQAKLSSAGQLCISSTADAHVVLDIGGYWR
jgi:hypothetical protein